MLGVLLLSACNPTRHLAEGEYLLDKNVLVIDNGDVDAEELEGIIKQSANRRIANVFRFHLWVYNSVKPRKARRIILRRQTRISRRNMRRMVNGKDSLEYSPTYQEWKLYTIGEPPVILDTSLLYKSEQQMELFLRKKGYFQNEVTVTQDTLKRRIGKGDKQRIVAKFDVITGPPHIVKELHFNSEDERLQTIVDRGLYEKKDGKTNKLTKIEIGKPLDTYLLEEERDRMVKHLRDNAYWQFTKDYISFNADTTQGKREVVLTMKIRNPKQRHPSIADSVVEVEHPQFKIRHVTFITDYDPAEPRNLHRDTLFHVGPLGKEHFFLFSRPMEVNPDLLIQSNFLRPQNWWKQKYVERTYKRLSEMGIYRNINIEFQQLDAPGQLQYMDVIFVLTPNKRKSFALEADGTNKGGLLGVSSGINYGDKNPWGGGENLKVSFHGGLEVQRTLTDDDSETTTENSSSIINAPFLNNFNTLEFGPEASLTLPKFLFPISLEKQSRSAMPFTTANLAWNFQKRPDYTRQLFHASFGYRFNETKTKTHEFQPLQVSLVKINKSAAFEARLDSLNDALLQNSYQDHLIFGLNYTFTYNSQLSPVIRDRRNRYFFQGRVEFAGNILRALHKLGGGQLDEFGSYEIFNIRFAQYFLADLDFRYYRAFSSHSSLATRMAGGLGVAMENLPVLPFEKSFFGGGANGLRAWKSRSVGPGSYFDPNLTFDKIGDVRLEGNIEYRFDLISFIEGAVFVDAGNIWLLRADSLRTGGEFEFSRFYKETGIGAGLGARLDFSFFIVRLDVAVPIRNPALPETERWIWQDHPIYDTWNDNVNRFGINLNIGIGYPF